MALLTWTGKIGEEKMQADANEPDTVRNTCPTLSVCVLFLALAGTISHRSKALMDRAVLIETQELSGDFKRTDLTPLVYGVSQPVIKRSNIRR